MSGKIAKKQKIKYVVGIATSAILVLLAFCGRYFNGFLCSLGNFLLGSFGMAFYGLMAAVIVFCSFGLSGKSIMLPTKYLVHFVLLALNVILFVHIIPTFFYPAVSQVIDSTDFAQYTKYMYYYYNNSGLGLPTFGGVVFGTIAYGLAKVLTVWGALILSACMMAFDAITIGDFFYKYSNGTLVLDKQEQESAGHSEAFEEITDENEADAVEAARKKAVELLFSNQESSIHPEELTEVVTPRVEIVPQSQIVDTPITPQEPTAQDILFGDANQKVNSFFTGSSANNNLDQTDDDNDDYLVKGFYSTNSTQNEVEDVSSDWIIDNSVNKAETTVSGESEQDIDDSFMSQGQSFDEVESDSVDEISSNDQFGDYSKQNDDVTEQIEELESEDNFDNTYSVNSNNTEQKSSNDNDLQSQTVDVDQSDDELVVIETETPFAGGAQLGLDFRTKGEIKQSQEQIHSYSPYVSPELDLLDNVVTRVDDDEEDRQRCIKAITEKLAVFGIEVEYDSAVVGPTVTRYLFNVLSKTRMGDFSKYSDDIKACVEATGDVRIEAPVQGTDKVGVEVENKHKSFVYLRTILESEEFKNANGKLTFAIGQEISGKVIVGDLSKMPHLLVAGTTGSGKSVCINNLIVSMMYKYGPEYVRFLMVDPKLVELSRYNGIPHMLTSEAIEKMSDALAGMDYLISEMENRYALFKQNRVGSIAEYNKYVNTKINAKMPYLVFIVDELADLMSTCKKGFEAKLMRLAQKARAAGIHIVLATQRPDTNVITGTIKANLPCRMALKVASFFDSKTIIDRGGAERLIGNGDMLFMRNDTPELARIQCAYVSEEEIRRIVDHSMQTNESYYDPNVVKQIFVPEEEPAADEPTEPVETLDPLCKKALRYWLESNAGKASISSLTRSLNVGFNRGGRILRQLQELKYVETPSASETNSKQLKVLVTLDQLDTLFPDMEG